MGVPYFNTFMGGDASKTVDANWEDVLRVWPEIVSHADAHGVKVTIENCPMIFSDDEWPGGHNIAWSPYVWRRILAEVGRHDRPQLRPLAPGVADDRPGAVHHASSGRTSSTSRPRT